MLQFVIGIIWKINSLGAISRLELTFQRFLNTLNYRFLSNLSAHQNRKLVDMDIVFAVLFTFYGNMESTSYVSCPVAYYLRSPRYR